MNQPHHPDPRQYQLRVAGGLSAQWSEWFEGFTITPAENGETLITGWVAEGFVRATGYVPQRWHVLLITYENGAPVVTPIELAADNTATAEFSLSSDGGGRPFLIIAASSPMTLEPAHYQFELTQ